MPLLSAVGAKAFGFASNALRAILDTFTRTTVGLLGITNSDHQWKAIRGIWFANGSQASSAGNASDYPIAAIEFQSDIPSASAQVSAGTGVAFWVTDANSWWASAYVQQNYSYNYYEPCIEFYYNPCKTCTGTGCAGACGNGVPASPDTMNCACGNGGTSYSYSSCSTLSFIDSFCNGAIISSGCGSGLYRCRTTVTTPDSMNCACGNATSGSPDTNNCGCCCNAGYDQYSTNCLRTGYGTNHLLRLINSNGGVVSSATGDVSLGDVAALILVSTSGNAITAKAYNASSVQIGSTLSHTPSSPTRGRSVGIIKAPSDNQGSTIESFNVSIGA